MVFDVPGALLVRGGEVLAMGVGGEALSGGDVLMEGGRVVAVGRGLVAGAGVRVVEAGGRLVLPGLVDTHRHLWLGGLFGLVDGGSLGSYAQRVNGEIGGRYRPEDVYAGVLWGALQALNAGVTTVADWAHNLRSTEHADANLGALAESGIRAVFYYGGPGADTAPTASPSGSVAALHDEVLRLARGLPERVTLGLGLRGVAFGTVAEAEAEFELARALGLPVSVHVGMAGFPDTVHALDELGVLGPDVNHVHANELRDAEFDAIAASGGTVSMSPTVELSMGLGGHTAWRPVRARGIPAGLASDTVAAAGTDLFSEMRLALATERARISLVGAVDAGPDAGVVGAEVSAVDVLRLATSGGAGVLPLPVRAGVLEPGAVADLIVMDASRPHLDGCGDPALALVLGAGAGDVETVIVDGEIRKEHGRLTGVAERAREMLATSRARLRLG